MLDLNKKQKLQKIFFLLFFPRVFVILSFVTHSGCIFIIAMVTRPHPSLD